MKQPMWKKLVCMGLIVTAAIVSGCRSGEKVAVVNYQTIAMKSPKVKAIEAQIETKNNEIASRLEAAQKQGLSQDELQSKFAEAQQEQAIFLQSKQNQVESMVSAQCQKIAKDKGYTIVLRNGMVPYGATDITDEVIAGLNQGSSSSETK